MKGKNTFTSSEIADLRSLIKERIKADSSRQKGIRAKMRKIGFFGGDDFGIDDLQPSDFEKLITDGRIKILGQELPEKNKSLLHKLEKDIDANSTPMYKIDIELFDPQINSFHHIPDNSGNYLVCLKKDSNLPDIAVNYEMVDYQSFRVIYTGIAGTSLRNRDYKKHFIGNNAGSSTLRKSLGSLFGYPKIARDKDPNTGKTKFNEIDEIELSKWMKSNLVLFFLSNMNPNKFEDELIKIFNPPLNLSKNKNTINLEFRKKLSELRRKK